MEVDAANDYHAEGDDHSDAAGDGAAYRSQKQENNFDHKVNDVP